MKFKEYITEKKSFKNIDDVIKFIIDDIEKGNQPYVKKVKNGYKGDFLFGPPKGNVSKKYKPAYDFLIKKGLAGKHEGETLEYIRKKLSPNPGSSYDDYTFFNSIEPGILQIG